MEEGGGSDGLVFKVAIPRQKASFEFKLSSELQVGKYFLLMAPPHKLLHTRNSNNKMMSDEDFVNFAVPSSPPDLDDTLSSMYRRIRGYLRDPFLNAEQKRTAVDSCVHGGAE